jgi:hypothetical protein
MPAAPRDHSLDFIRSASAAPLVSHVLNPQRLVQFVQLDQRKRLASDVASASHAEGRWFDPSRDHFRLRRSSAIFAAAKLTMRSAGYPAQPTAPKSVC